MSERSAEGLRPTSVRDVSVLLSAVAALALVMVVAGLVALQHLHVAGPAYERALAGKDPAVETGDLGRRLGYDIAVGAGLALLTGWLAWSVRFPARWSQRMTWVVTVVAWFALGCGVAAPAEQVAPDDALPAAVNRLAADLLHFWYPALHSIVVYGALAALTAASVILLREVSQDYYRPKTGGKDQNWGSFIDKYDH